MGPGETLQDLRRLKRLTAELVFDTADHPLPIGVRRIDVTSRHWLYEVDDLTIDVRIEKQRGSRALLIGQLASRLDPLEPSPSVVVHLASSEQVLGHALSNREGEFQIGFSPRRHMTLVVPVGQGIAELPVDRRTTKRPTDLDG